MTPSNISQILEETFAPAIDAKAPYAQVMFKKAALEIARQFAAEIDPLRDCLRALANSCDAVGVKHFDTDDMSDEVTSMQQVTQAARHILKS